ncbi:MAG: TolC family protein [Chitinophagales bacterium]
MKTYFRIYLLLTFLLGACLGLKAQTLEELMQMAVDQNPELKSLQSEYEAALQKGPQVSQLADVQIGIGVPILRPETRLGGQVLTVSASQMFPWFGTLKAKEDIVLTMAKSKYERLAALQLDLFYQIKSAYYQLFLIEQEQAIIKENLRLYSTMENVALGKVESGKSIASDVLKVGLKIKKLENQLQLLENNKAPLFAQINETTNRSIQDSIYIVESFDNIAILNFFIDDYQKRIEENHPVINQLNWELQNSDKALALNKLSGLPSFGVGLDYSLVQPRTDMLPDNNGRDILIPKVMMTIPIARKKYKAKEAEESLNKEAFEYKKESVVNQMMTALQTYKTEYDNALLELEFYNQQIIMVNSTYNILLSEYSSSGSRFDELIRIQDDLLDYKLKILEAYLQTHIAVAKIDRLTNF